MVLSPAFWNHIVYALKVSSPLVHVLQLVYNEKKSQQWDIFMKPWIGLKKPLPTHLMAMKRNTRAFLRMLMRNGHFNCIVPLHGTEYFLNHEFFYPNKMRIESNEEVNTGLLSCIHKIEKDSVKVDMILDEIERYKATTGTFGFPSAVRGRTTKSPAAWWKTYSSSTLNIQKFVVKVMSLTYSASGCERN
ncbi:uncharacterized protein LOC131169341 [Hevea brasiliensis]|uniref:uncharacterized protein LOC131169341 n=1 Tax=Hevea brasiliensis TaxID=3981 RepID=UPI0025E0F3E7|nr:uncharacterized protein LOC131169341 [Hevea brasiliensis]